MAKGDTGELLLGRANAYIDTFVRRAIEMIWDGPKDIRQIAIPWVEKPDQTNSGRSYRDYNGNVYVEHNGIEVVIAFYIKLYPQDHVLPTNIFGWAPRDFFACAIRSIPSLKDVRVDFDQFAAEGEMDFGDKPEKPVLARPKLGSFANVLRIREELGISSEQIEA